MKKNLQTTADCFEGRTEAVEAKAVTVNKYEENEINFTSIFFLYLFEFIFFHFFGIFYLNIVGCCCCCYMCCMWQVNNGENTINKNTFRQPAAASAD